MDDRADGLTVISMLALVTVGIALSIWFYHDAMENTKKYKSLYQIDDQTQADFMISWTRLVFAALFTLSATYGFFKAFLEYMSY
jgi:hypothetical protein